MARMLRRAAGAVRGRLEVPPALLVALGWALLMTATAGQTAVAQSFFETARPFSIVKPCAAFRSFKRKTGAVALEMGRTYEARGENAPKDATHAFIRVGTESLWVELTCGRYEGRGPEAAGVAGEGGGQSAAHDGGGRAAGGGEPGACPPFFDGLDNPTPAGFDITPPAPVLNDFDRKVMATCGAPGKVVPEAEFQALMRADGEVLQRIMAFSGGRVFADRPARNDAESFLADLTEAWFVLKAFDHILCGEPDDKRGSIGGLHFHGRYLQLQETGAACRMTNYRQNEVVPGVIYTMGVAMRTAKGGWARHATKGYGLTLSAEDILKVVTRAFAENPTTSRDSVGCVLPMRDDGKAFDAVFVRRAAGIRTFYPDATPNGRGGPQTPRCAAAIAVQE